MFSVRSSNLANEYRRTHRVASAEEEQQQQQQQQQQEEEEEEGPSGIESDPFLDAFFAIDEDASETITAEELRAYAEKNNFREGFAQKWLKMFDLDGDGVISLYEFCEVLGLEQKNARTYRRESIIKSGMPEDIKIIDDSMPEDMQLSIVQLTLLALLRNQDARKLVRDMKTQLDDKYGLFWHVALVIGKHYASYSHEPHRSFVFRARGRVFMVWKTPEA